MSKPTDDQYQLYEKARKRTKQKKGLLSHFIFFLIGAIFLVILNKGVEKEVELKLPKDLKLMNSVDLISGKNANIVENSVITNIAEMSWGMYLLQ